MIYLENRITTEQIKSSCTVLELYRLFCQVYKGYVDDPRNTDNSWMETVAVNFHDETGDKQFAWNNTPIIRNIINDKS